MYFMDFASSNLIAPSCRYFLSGDNQFLKNFAIDKMSKATGRPISRVASVSEMAPKGLFGVDRLYVLGSKSNPKTFHDFMIKLSSAKMGKTYKDAGFIEVVCSSLFPNQVEQFASMLMKEQGIAPGQARTIAKIAKYDPFTVYNAIHALSYVEKKLTNEELINYCKNLTTPDTFKIIDYFIEGAYTDFIDFIRESRTNIHEILWSLLGAISRLHKAHKEAALANSWYLRRMTDAASKIAPYGFEKIIVYVNDMCTAYGESREVLLLKLQKLLFYLRGFINQL